MAINFENLESISVRPPETTNWRERYDWSKIILLLGSPVVAAALLALHYHYEKPVPALWWIALFLYLVAQCSISAGYHRLYTHKAYKAHRFIHFVFLFFAPSAMQNSALKWCNDHRRHHAFTDTDADPHTVTRGFFYSHMGWVMGLDKRKHRTNMVKDLIADSLLLWQYKYYQLLFLFHLVALPLAIGWYFGAPIGGLAIVGWCKALAGLHGTFFVNSAAHGYFPASIDPGKWVIWSLSRVGLAWDLKKIDPKVIEAKISAQSV